MCVDSVKRCGDSVALSIQKLKSVFVPEESTVAVIHTLVVAHRLVLDLTIGVNCLLWFDRLLIFSGDDRDHHKGCAVVILPDGPCCEVTGPWLLKCIFKKGAFSK